MRSDFFSLLGLPLLNKQGIGSTNFALFFTTQYVVARLFSAFVRCRKDFQSPEKPFANPYEHLLSHLYQATQDAQMSNKIYDNLRN
jgi:hypothetical protein